MVSNTKFELYCDGGARGNPGPAAIGVVCYRDKETIFEITEYIGETTNNIAEYRALIAGLEELSRRQITEEVAVYLDSELVVRQVNGQYRVKDSKLQPLYGIVQDLKQNFQIISFDHIPRIKNKIADSLVNKSLDEHQYVK